MESTDREETTLLVKNQLCEKIRAIYPDIGRCGIEVDVGYDEEQASTVIHLCKGNKRVRHYMPDADVEACMTGRQCVALGIEIAQLRDERYL